MNIFLIEDVKQEFDLIKEGLLKYSYTIIPSNYEIGFIEIHAFLDDPSEQNKTKLIEYICQQKIQFILLDIKLWGEQDGGNILYNRVFSQDERTMKIPVIYLTKTKLQSELRLNKRTGYVEKILNSNGFDIDETVTRLKTEIDKLQKMNNSSLEWGINNL